MKNKSIKQLARLSLFLAVGVVLNILEAQIPLPIPIPGVKLGLANTIGLVVLYFFGIKEYLLVGLLRVLLVGLLRTGIGSPAFFLSLGGFLLSSIITVIIYLLVKPSIYGLSVTSAIFHPVGQVIVACIYYSQILFINYLPVLLGASIVSGILVALVAQVALRTLSKGIRK